jgi:ParB family chromosome partitioning protein
MKEMTNKRKTIGRTFSQSPLSEKSGGDDFSQTFILHSGKRVIFTLLEVEAGKVATETFVIPENNGRDQSALTAASLKDITRTLKLQQFFPAIGRRVGEQIEILDGSRRRAAAIICHTTLNVLVTDADISTEDARKLASDIQTAKEHNLREVGLRLASLKESGMSQKEIAASEGLSQAKVTRALQAAMVPSEILAVFPVQSELTYPDYKQLLSLCEFLTEKQVTVDDFLKDLDLQISMVYAQELSSSEETKTALLGVMKKALTKLISSAGKEKVVTTPLWIFADKDRFARKKVKGRQLSYEFNRLPKDIQEELDTAINDILNRFLAD